MTAPATRLSRWLPRLALAAALAAQLAGCASRMAAAPAPAKREEAQRRAMQYFVRAKVFESQGNHLGAIVALRSAADLDPDSPTIMAQLAHNYERIRDLGMAASFARRALELDPELQDLRYRLVRWLDVAGREEEAAVALEELIGLEPANWPLYSHLAHLYLETGQQERIGELYGRLLARDDIPSEARVNAAHVLSRAGERQRAEQVFAAVLVEDPQAEDAWIGLCEAQLSRGDRLAGMETLRRAGRVLEDSPLVMHELAGLVATPDELAQILSDADAYFTYRLGVALSERERYELAAQAFERIVYLRPTAVSGWLDAARFYLHVSDYGKVDSVMTQAVEAMPDSLELYLFWAGALERGERPAGADSVYARAAERCAAEADLYLYWGFALEQRQEWDAAIEVYRRGLVAADAPAELYIRWGLSLARQERWQEAAARFRSAAQANPEASDAHLHWGVALQRLARWPEAIERLTEAARLDSEGTFSLFSLGSCLEQAARELADDELFQRAVATFEQVLEMDPTDAFALNYLGYMFAERGVHLERAVELLRRALDIDPDNGAFLDSMGWAYYQLGDLVQAQHYLERALSRIEAESEAMSDEERAVILEHAGDVARDRGEPGTALDLWQRALDLQPSSATLRDKVDGAQSSPAPGAAAP